MVDTDKMQILRANGIGGAATASGPTIVIDVFRAFSAAAYAFAAGAERIVLAAEVAEAARIAGRFPDAVLMGEQGGVRPDGFHLGNSPGEIVDHPQSLAGKTIVHRSSAGTRAARAALYAGAGPVYLGSLVVASATVAAVGHPPAVTLVSSGESGTGPSEEDDICADLLADLFIGDPRNLATSGTRTATCRHAAYLRQADFAHPNDVTLCTDIDRFDFAMRARLEDGITVVKPFP
jgi:2-phosphosulfolactate phosphatase